ncbi:MAG TPA: thiol reductant ABC exporter subunit CydC, partial [Chloroflexota bacterium]|nr:thiol reductant ABC exporter subunit CydC [Chloroflexota bacterium]
VLTILSSVGLLAVSAYLIERASQRPPILSLMVAIVAVRLFGIARGPFRYADRYLSHDASFRLLGAMRADIYRTIIPLVPVVPAGLSDLGRGELLARIAADVDTMQEWFVRGFTPVCVSALTLLIVSVAAAILLPLAGLTLLLTLLAASLLVMMAARTRGEAAHQEIGLRGKITAATVDYFQGLSDLVALGVAHDAASTIEATERRRAGLVARRARRSASGIGVQTALPGMIAALLGAVTITLLSNGLNPLQVGVLVFAGMAAAECTFALPGAVAAWERGLAAARRLGALSHRPYPVAAGGATQPVQLPCRLEISDLCFGYDDASPRVLDSVSLRVEMGDRVVITGRSGAGKTTLATLLLRFLSPDRGIITLDGVDIGNLTESYVRQSIGAATQHAHLFAGTIRDNVLLARPGASDDELRDAIDRAQLGDWIAELPDGWNTEVGERGVAVSGGQRRRIALARALLAGFPFLIADEPTEGLDEATARSVMDTLFTATEGRGVIVITHRPDLCPYTDAVYGLERGHLRPRDAAHQTEMAPSDRR